MNPYGRVFTLCDVTYYHVWVAQAVNWKWASVDHAEDMAAQHPECSPPETPENFEAIMASDGQITLSWTAEPGCNLRAVSFHTGNRRLHTNVMKISGMRTSPYNHQAYE